MTRFVGVPNPNPQRLALELSGPADSIEVVVYGPALVRLKTLDFAGPFAAGWVAVSLPSDWDGRLSDGLYYAAATARRGGAVSLPTAPARLVLLR